MVYDSANHLTFAKDLCEVPFTVFLLKPTDPNRENKGLHKISTTFLLSNQ